MSSKSAKGGTSPVPSLKDKEVASSPNDSATKKNGPTTNAAGTTSQLAVDVKDPNRARRPSISDNVIKAVQQVYFIQLVSTKILFEHTILRDLHDTDDMDECRPVRMWSKPI
jgi:hypothetical protein